MVLKFLMCPQVTVYESTHQYKKVATASHPPPSINAHIHEAESIWEIFKNVIHLNTHFSYMF